MRLIDEFKARGLVEALTDPAVEEALEKPLTVYCGFDPSAKSLQAGNLVSIMVLRRLQLAGHRVIALVGGATGLIGDPSGKSAERNMLTREQVAANKAGIRENLSRILDFDGPNAATMVDNYDWYEGMSAIEFLRDVAINFRVPQMLAKESVKKRLEASEGALTFTEFSYQILQGNDFLHLFDRYGCSLEVGGADQWGNITAGTDLVRKMRGKSAYGLTFPLLLDSAGRKFGKSEGNALFMDAALTPVFDWYQYFLRTPDADVIRYMKVFSMKSLDEIAALEAEMKARPEERIPQKALAEELTRLVHGEEGLRKAREAKRREFIQASAKFVEIEVDPFNIYDLPPVERMANDRTRRLSLKQEMLLRTRLHVDPQQLGYARSNQLLQEFFRRANSGLASLPQSKLLKRFGIDVPLRSDEAKRIIDRCLAGRR